jgi:hypothetical protein
MELGSLRWGGLALSDPGRWIEIVGASAAGGAGLEASY